MENKITKPIIGFSIGDLNGVGPELIVDYLADTRLLDKFTPVIYGSGRLFVKYRKLLDNKTFNFNQVDKIEDIKTEKINIINLWDDDIDVNFGHVTPEGGKFAFVSLKFAVADLVSNKIDALVTCPINKDNIQSDEFKFPGHTEYITLSCNMPDSVMMLTSDELKVGVVTGHIPLKEIPNAITEEKIITKAEIMLQTLHEDFGIDRPKLAVLGLNPHAGDNGLLGSEEKEIITPAIKKLKDKNLMVFGPFSADGFFGNYEFQKFDGVLAMYHDQGLIPFKTICFEKGINYTAGLPIVRTCPDHGTAYAIAGKGRVNPGSFLESIYKAIDIIIQRKNHKQERL